MSDVAKYFASGLLGAVGQEAEKINMRRYEQEDKAAEVLKQMSLYELKSRIDQRDKIADEERAADAAKGVYHHQITSIDPDTGDKITQDVDINGKVIGDQRVTEEYTPKTTMKGNVLYTKGRDGKWTAEDIPKTEQQKKDHEIAIAALEKDDAIKNRTYFTQERNTAMEGMRTLLKSIGDEDKTSMLIAAIRGGEDTDTILPKGKLSPEQVELLNTYKDQYTRAQKALDDNPYSSEGMSRAEKAKKIKSMITSLGVDEKAYNTLKTMPQKDFDKAKNSIVNSILNNDRQAINSLDVLTIDNPKRAGELIKAVETARAEYDTANNPHEQNQPMPEGSGATPLLDPQDKTTSGGLLVDPNANPYKKNIYANTAPAVSDQDRAIQMHIDKLKGLSSQEIAQKLSEWEKFAKTNKVFAKTLEGVKQELGMKE